ncbi:hypothetical protein A8L34_25020 [Bacillus sp. FJAT-27264]|uniref:hypothetical protein n=1 Tax=Paenibacillus sp. (strain DSM 101736 / FJAT-27264) TaxID=1850362 RepID=UPI000807C7E7|nr:hypothetical protein [Bacillus sp. FJAT-27264]OBZ07894.1 hypothetical protein A8L34_25020 [Bacillus sp. FJAT-27264]
MNTVVIDTSLKKLEDITATLLQKIDLVSYEELSTFADERELLVQRIIDSQEFISSEHVTRLKELKEYDQVILFKMEDFKNEASKWLSKQGAIREQKNAYGASYNVDSFFVDHKK